MAPRYTHGGAVFFLWVDKKRKYIFSGAAAGEILFSLTQPDFYFSHSYVISFLSFLLRVQDFTKRRRKSVCVSREEGKKSQIMQLEKAVCIAYIHTPISFTERERGQPPLLLDVSQHLPRPPPPPPPPVCLVARYSFPISRSLIPIIYRPRQSSQVVLETDRKSDNSYLQFSSIFKNTP